MKFRWNFDFSGGAAPSLSRSWSVDDIRVTGTSASGLSDGEAASAWPGTAFEMTAFPNPTADQLFIRFSQDVDTGMLTVNDMQGRELQRLDVQNLRSGEELPVNLGDLPERFFYFFFKQVKKTPGQLLAK